MIDILVIALNDKRIRHMAMESVLFVSEEPASNLHIGMTALSLRIRILGLRDRESESERAIGHEGVPLHRGVLCAWGLHCVLY